MTANTLLSVTILLGAVTCAVAQDPGPRPPRRVGFINNDTSPETTPFVWDSSAVRPALDYQNRSFGLNLGVPARVESVTIVNDLPRTGCRIDAAHTELYYGDRNGEFQRYTGPLLFRKGLFDERVLIILEGLDLTTTILKVRFTYEDTDWTSCAASLEGAMTVNDPDASESARQVGLRVDLQGAEQLPTGRVTRGAWQAVGDELVPVDLRHSERYSGEGARVFLPYRVTGDFAFAC